MQDDGRRDYEVVETEVLIIGAGAAGLRAAIALKQQGVEDILVLGNPSGRRTSCTERARTARWSCGPNP